MPIELVDGDSVQKAGKMILDLAEREGWSGCLIYQTVVELARFLERQGIESLDADDICRN